MRLKLGTYIDIGQWILLEQQFQRNNLVKFHSRNTTNKTLSHGFVFSNVKGCDGVELSIGRCFERIRKVVDLRLVVVNFHAEFSALVKPLNSDIVKLSGQEILVGKHHFLSLKAKIENKPQMARIGHHESEKLFADITVGPDQKAFGIGSGETHVDLFGNGRLIIALEIILDHVIGPHIYADLISTNGSFERCPATITIKVVIALFANPTVHTGINGVAFSGTPDAYPVDPVGLAVLVGLDSLALQVNVDTIENKGSHAAHEAI